MKSSQACKSTLDFWDQAERMVTECAQLMSPAQSQPLPAASSWSKPRPNMMNTNVDAAWKDSLAGYGVVGIAFLILKMATSCGESHSF